jgi:hypothetical protein
LNALACRSKSWVEEEGEVFRKGTVLLGPEDMEREYDSEALRKEVSCSLFSCPVDVERSSKTAAGRYG